MLKKSIAVAALAVVPLFAFAQSSSELTPGARKAQSSGSEVTGTTITVSGNKAKNVKTIGSEATTSGQLQAVASSNVNSVVIRGSKVTSSTINVLENTAEDILTQGAASNNTNSVVIN